MLTRTLLLLIGLCLIVTACAVPTPMAAPTPMTTEAAPAQVTSSLPEAKGMIRFGYVEPLGSEDIPLHMALDKLSAQGYEVEKYGFARFDLGLNALIEGNLDVANSSLQPAWAAIGKGAPIKTIVSRLKNVDLMATTTRIQACSDLEGKNVGLSSATSLNAVMLGQYVARHCPGTRYQVVPIPSSNNRLAALSTGAIDATNLRPEDMLILQMDNPGKFHALASFGSEFPEIQFTAFQVHNDFAAQHPGTVRDFIRALVMSVREVQDPATLNEQMTKYLDLDPRVQEIESKEFASDKLWDLNGGLTDGNVEATLDFLIAADAVPNNLTSEMVIDLSYLNDVLKEIGRK